MVVVTSPIGDQAPPAFAAITTTPTKYFLVCESEINLRKRVTMTMAVVKLSKAAEMKNVTIPTIHKSLAEFFVCINWFTNLKP